ncbi:MAG: cytochrome-c oxidase, cbb3-type subunit II [Rubellimicrobium sp.]|nr:cytochrome-c oxidase, cbb3-type subunit II [Rubellimicrobium sp.]
MVLRLHYNLEKMSVGLVVGIIVAASIGGIVEIAPLFTIDGTADVPADMRPQTPLELAGREIYMREGCYACHSQMIRTLADEIDRYGPYSVTSESVFDHPMLWGSKRTGPDLARLGEKYSDDWHVLHLLNPRDVVPDSIMPAYPWLMSPLDTRDIGPEMAVLATLGVPYTDEQIANAATDAAAQARPDSSIADGFADRWGDRPALRAFDGDADEVTEMDALVAYLQSLGTLTDVAWQNPAEEEGE